jgi:aspartyl-tRNA(Asn)/glutamyl-tRNA(Gln) amidotransferase subunit B
MIEQLMSRSDLANFYKKSTYRNKLLFAKILFSVILPLANKNNCKISDLNIPMSKLDQSLSLLENQEISMSHIKILIPLLSGNNTVQELVTKHKMFIISSPEKINEIMQNIFKEEAKIMESTKNDPDKLGKILLGKLMKKTGGQVNMVVANQVISSILNSK